MIRPDTITPEQAIKMMDINEAYNSLLLEINDSEGETIKKKARFGIRIPIDIYEWIDETVNIKTKKGVVITHGKKYKLKDVLTEIENRNVLIKKYLLKKAEKQQLITPRGINI